MDGAKQMDGWRDKMTGDSLDGQTDRKQGCQSYNQKKMNSAVDLSDLGKGFFLGQVSG